MKFQQRFRSPMVSAIFLTAAFTLVQTPARSQADSDQMAKLSWVPHSTSYQPWNQNPMSRLPGEYSPLSVARRFDMARASVLGETGFSYEAFFNQNRWDPSRPWWGGFCNRWATGALDLALSTRIDQSGGLVCNDVVFTRPELRELVTSFYPDDAYQTFGAFSQVVDPVILQVRSQLGVDPLGAEVFHRVIYESFQSNKGVILNIGSMGEVWNFPAYKIRSHFEDISLADIKDQFANFSVLPGSIYLGRTARAQSLLTSLRAVESALRPFKLNFLPKADFVILGQAWSKSTRTSNDNQPTSPLTVTTLLAARASLQSQLQNLLAAGELSLDPSVHVQKVHSILTYAIESKFVSGDDNHKTSKYDYFLVTANGETTGAWITAPKDRPGTLWTPKSAAKADGSANPYSDVLGLSDVYQLLLKCKARN